ncbi:MAG: DNA repair protein RecN [Bryobacteraceae bacterium]|nr:DNA repair protein RecN [Bryobacteraceae bacterium]
MLVELTVENFAVVERLRLRLHPGFNALTGETGSGKSLVVDALSLLFGGRASAEMIRTGAPRAFVSGLFALPSDPRLQALLTAAGLEPEDGELLIERELLPGGKSRAFAASRPVTVALLREIAPFLGDIHGQHDQQKLFSSDAQRELLDEAWRSAPALERTAQAHAHWHEALRALADLQRAEQEQLRLADLWRLQCSEIEPLELQPGEDTELENQRRVLKNVTRLAENVTAAYNSLSEDQHSAAAQLSVALRRLEEIAPIDDQLGVLVDSLTPARIAVQDAAHELRHYLGALEADPARLEEVEARLARIEKLKRKYGNSIPDILAFAAEARARLDAVSSAGERRAALERQAAEFESAFLQEAKNVTMMREKAAKTLHRQLENELSALAMKGARFRVLREPAPPAPHGVDSITFLLSANSGEEPKPLDKIASGGELSRIALGLKTCLQQDTVSSAGRTLVFDEVDAGVGGAAGEAVGRRLQALAAAGNQVLCVTHLAQIAGLADHHFSVSKRDTRGRTTVEVDELAADARVSEIARMLSGEQISVEARKHAEKILKEAKKC